MAHGEGTHTVRASELGDRVLSTVHVLRNPGCIEEHESALVEYKKLRGRRKEVERRRQYGGQERGFYRLVDGEPKFHPRPELARPGAWIYLSYDRGFSIGGQASPSYSRQLGLLADPTHNRDIRPQRVWEYQAEMESGN